MKEWKPTQAALDLMLAGQLAYAEIESVGVRVDKTYLDHAIKMMERDIGDMERDLLKHDVAREWKRVYGDKMNFESPDQQADIFFNVLKIESTEHTAKGKRSLRKNVLEQVDHDFVRDYLQIKPMRNSLRTNLIGIRREMVERDSMWFVHPIHNLNSTQTYRPSSQLPNWRNFPKRNPETARRVRPAFIPRPGRRFGETDQAQIEIRVPGALTGDQALRRYIMDKSTDMHRDQAMEVFFLRKDEVTKPVRSQVKNNFVFNSFYGGAYYNAAKLLWDDITIFKLATANGTPMKEHLERYGVTRRGDVSGDGNPEAGTFVAHVRDCQQKLWGRFQSYRDWRRAVVDSYHRDGGMRTATGFVIVGPHTPLQIANYGIQGPAYQITLASVIEILRRRRKYKFKTLVLGDIYDSVQYDIVDSELQDWTDMTVEVMTRWIPKQEQFKWLGDVPLECEVELSEIDGSWYSTEEWTRQEGKWAPKKKAA